MDAGVRVGGFDGRIERRSIPLAGFFELKA
jgi:hypothetical protein